MSQHQLEQSELVKSILGKSILIDLGVNRDDATQLLTDQALMPELIRPSQVTDAEPQITQKPTGLKQKVDPLQSDSAIVDSSLQDEPQVAEGGKKGRSFKLRFKPFGVDKREAPQPSPVGEPIFAPQAESTVESDGGVRFTLSQVALVSLTAVAIAVAAYSSRAQILDFSSEQLATVRDLMKVASPAQKDVPHTATSEVAASEHSTGQQKKTDDVVPVPSSGAAEVTRKDEAEAPTTVKVISGAYVPVDPPKADLPKPLPAPVPVPGNVLPTPMEKSAVKVAGPATLPAPAVPLPTPSKPITNGGPGSPADSKEAKQGPLVLDDTSKVEALVKKDPLAKAPPQASVTTTQPQTKPITQPAKEVAANESVTKPATAVAPKVQGVTVVDVPKDGKSVMVTNPTNRLPMKLVPGERLPNGKVIQSINGSSGSVVTTDGVTYSME